MIIQHCSPTKKFHVFVGLMMMFDPHHHREDSLKKELVRMSTGPASMNDYAGLNNEHEEWLQQRNDVSEWLDRQVPVSDDHIPLLLPHRQPQS